MATQWCARPSPPNKEEKVAMPFSYEDVIVSQAQNLDSERAQMIAELEAGRLSDDAYRTTEAAKRICQIDVERQQLNSYANQIIHQQQQQPRGSQFGLSRDEQEIAAISGISEQEYLANKQKMHAMKDQGYWSQGRVFK
jgi:hypothetical protein